VTKLIVEKEKLEFVRRVKNLERKGYEIVADTDCFNGAVYICEMENTNKG
jgi:hypothetical protein